MSFFEPGLDARFTGRPESQIWSLLTGVSKSLVELAAPSWVVGGFVRDWLLGRATADVDIAVRADALETAARIASSHGGNHIVLDKENGVARVILPGDKAPASVTQCVFDFSTVPGTIEQDLARRDFTVDAMAVELSRMVEYLNSLPPAVITSGDLAPPGLIDPFHGWDDLRQRVIRAVSDRIFIDDAARLLRAVRLAAELDFEIDETTKRLIHRDSSLVSAVSGERVREELLRLLSAGLPERLLLYLGDSGLLTAIFPEMAEAKGVKQPAEHFWTVFDHSLQTVLAVDFLLRRGTWQYASEKVLDSVPWSAEWARHFEQEVSHGSTRRSLLKLAALLHDVAKPQTRAIDDSGRMRFLGHAQQGAAIVANILSRLRFSAREIKLVETLVNYHLRPGQLSQDALPSNRAVYRYFRDTAGAGIDVLFLNLADHLATRGPNLIPANWREHTRLADYLLSRYLQDEKVTRPPKLVDGHDLIRAFNMIPGPEMGEVLEAVREAQAAGEVTTRQEALSFVRNWLDSTHLNEKNRPGD